jgi:hypothetical protein
MIRSAVFCPELQENQVPVAILISIRIRRR